MTESAKKPSTYTHEQTAQLIEMYKAGTTVEELAEHFQRSTRSIIAKLSREDGVYQKKTYKRKDDTPVQKKNDTADAIGAILGLELNDTDSLTKCTRRALQAIFNALANSKPL